MTESFALPDRYQLRMLTVAWVDCSETRPLLCDAGVASSVQYVRFSRARSYSQIQKRVRSMAAVVGALQVGVVAAETTWLHYRPIRAWDKGRTIRIIIRRMVEVQYVPEFMREVVQVHASTTAFSTWAPVCAEGWAWAWHIELLVRCHNLR
jgi:hypothetical protein